MSRVQSWMAAGLLVSLCLTLTPSAAQRPSPQPAAVVPGKLIALTVSGTTRYTDKEILAASGLRMGQPVADADFKEAVQQLGTSGLFSELSYTYSTSAAGVKLELQLSDTDASKLVPVEFENFVWFTDDELLTALQPRVPLFKRLLPLGGNLAGHVSEALQAILTERNDPGRVDYLREGQDQNGGPLKAIAYRVDEVDIVIHDFEFPGATPERSALLRTAARRAIGGAYARSGLAAVARLDLLPVYLQRGYLKAAFAPSDARVLPQPTPAQDARLEPGAVVQVDAILRVTPGQIYSTSAVDWKGNAAIPTTELAALFHLPPGEPVDAVRLLDDLKLAVKLYRSRGYMTAQIVPATQFDDDKGTVHYDLKVVEGDLYRMGDLDIAGLDTQATARMVAAWTLRQGQIYNADYLKKYLNDTGSILPRGVNWGVSLRETLDPKDRTVDVEIRFKQQ
jgi:outer membrane protein assembly factor BamA